MVLLGVSILTGAETPVQLYPSRLVQSVVYGFNPHRSRDPGATQLSNFTADEELMVSILTGAETPVQRKKQTIFVT